MATNKNKDAAALFELIDRSTLKVPKNAGALKIPSWWSSKTNPPTSPTQGEQQDEQQDLPTPEAPPASPAAVPQNTITPLAPMTPPAPAPASAPAENPLFSSSQPAVTPPAASTPTPVHEAPSIRPPVKPPVTPPTHAASTASPQAAATTAGKPRVAPPGMYVPNTTDANKASRKFAAPTATNPFPSHGPGVRSFPTWALVAGGAAVILFVALLLFMVLPGSGSNNQTANGSGNGGTVGPTTNLNPRWEVADNNNTNGNNGGNNKKNDDKVISPPPTKGRVFEPGQVARSRDLIYLVIAHDKSLENIRKNANFIAERGVDVSIERNSKGVYMLLSVQGFPIQNNDAVAFQKRVIGIGRDTPSYKRTGKAWDDAYFGKVSGGQ